MMAVGEDELLCDLAETYGLFNPWALPVTTVAVLAGGLGPESRIAKIISGQDDVSLDTLLRAKTVDLLSLLVWQRTEDGLKGRNVPKSVVDSLLHTEKKENKKLKSFKTAEDFMNAWKAGGGG